jgi:hypothetical protein
MEKFSGLNVKIWRPGIFGIYEIIFLKKILWIRSMDWGLGPSGRLMGSRHSETLRAIEFRMRG